MLTSSKVSKKYKYEIFTNKDYPIFRSYNKNGNAGSSRSQNDQQGIRKPVEEEEKSDI